LKFEVRNPHNSVILLDEFGSSFTRRGV
jgi:hypothetical protein